MSPSPSPNVSTSPPPGSSPIVVELANQATSVPWWGVPVIAGGFLILGGILTYVFTRLNDSTKHNRERKDRQVREIAQAGAVLLTAGDRVKELALLALPRTTAEFLTAISGKAKPATDAFAYAANAFLLVYPPSMKKTFDDYLVTTLVLLVPPFGKDTQTWSINKQTTATVKLVNDLRALEGRQPINEPATNPNMLEDAQKIMDTLSDALRDEAANGKHAIGTDSAEL